MIRAPFPLAAALVAAACSAADSPASGQRAFVPPQPPEASLPVPKNAPLPSVRNVPATTGRANLNTIAPSFAAMPIGRFDKPFAMAFLPDGGLLVTEKAGKLKLRRADGAVSDVAGVPAVAKGGQGGLLDIAVAPDFAHSRAIYFSYSESGGTGSQLALAKASLGSYGGEAGPPASPGAALSLSGLKVIWRSGSSGPGGQFGATIAFDPDGKSLFLSSGERQRFTPAQDPEQLLGKIVHLTLDGDAAPDNPEYAKGGTAAMTWSTGHRNPYGLLFAPDRRLWEVEMGPRGGDELNLIAPGKNYGWPVVSNGDNYSGQPIPDHPSRPDLAAPTLWWNPSISPGGMALYTGAMFPAWRGSLLIAALSAKSLIRVAVDGDRATAVDEWDMGTRIRDVTQAPDGAVWLLEDGEQGAQGRLIRLSRR